MAELRRDYNLAGLSRRDLAPDPITQFGRWFDDALGSRRGGRLKKLCVALYKKLLLIPTPEALEVNAATLATADKIGRPSARIVLLKGVDARGFIFFTNYESRKSRELADNPEAAMVFYWSAFERQVCIAGSVSRLPTHESEAYFKSRPRGSRLAAWASRQSEVIQDRATLQAKWKELEQQYAGSEVPMPPFWGGFVLSPSRVEFWQGRPSRLHDRFRYTRKPDNSWQIDRLSP